MSLPQQRIDDLSLKGETYYAELRPEMRRYVPDGVARVVDCGCGEGRFGGWLKSECDAEVWGIEMDEDAAGRAADVLDQVLRGDLESRVADLPDGHFDCAVFNDVLEHLVDPFSVLLDIKQKLGPGGVIVCSVPNIRFLLNFKDYVVRGQWRYEDYGPWDKTHLRCFTVRSFRDVLEELGYTVLRLEGINGIPSWKFRLFNLATMGFFRDLRYPQFACVARPR
jgi:SAM-dependent methyltransferase